MKLFKTGDTKIVKYCQPAFNIVISSVQITQKVKNLQKNNVIHECGIWFIYQIICAVR